MQLDPVKPKLKVQGTNRLKMEYDGLVSHSAFKFNLRRYTEDVQFYMEVMEAVQNLDGGRRNMYDPDEIEVGRCRSTLSNQR